MLPANRQRDEYHEFIGLCFCYLRSLDKLFQAEFTIKNTVILFPLCGGRLLLFNTWTRWLLPEVELYLVNLPGRDTRIREEPYRQLKPLIGSLHARTVASPR